MCKILVKQFLLRINHSAHASKPWIVTFWKETARSCREREFREWSRGMIWPISLLELSKPSYNSHIPLPSPLICFCQWNLFQQYTKKNCQSRTRTNIHATLERHWSTPPFSTWLHSEQSVNNSTARHCAWLRFQCNSSSCSTWVLKIENGLFERALT